MTFRRRTQQPNLLGLVTAGIQIHQALAERDAAVAAETRAEVAVETEAQLQAAYERGWRDACDDHLDQQHQPLYPIGTRYQQPYDPSLPQVPRILGGAR